MKFLVKHTARSISELRQTSPTYLGSPYFISQCGLAYSLVCNFFVTWSDQIKLRELLLSKEDNKWKWRRWQDANSNGRLQRFFRTHVEPRTSARPTPTNLTNVTNSKILTICRISDFCHTVGLWSTALWIGSRQLQTVHPVQCFLLDTVLDHRRRMDIVFSTTVWRAWAGHSVRRFTKRFKILISDAKELLIEGKKNN